MSELLLLLRHERGELGPKTIDEWAAPNGHESLLFFMLRSIEASGGGSVELVTVESRGVLASQYYAEVRP